MRLVFSLNNATLIIGGSTILINLLVDCREEFNCRHKSKSDNDTFEQECIANGLPSIVTDTDATREHVNITSIYRDNMLQWLLLRDKLKQFLMNHEIYCERKED